MAKWAEFLENQWNGTPLYLFSKFKNQKDKLNYEQNLLQKIIFK